MPVHTLKSGSGRARHLDQLVDVTEILKVDIAKREVTVRDASGPRIVPVRESFFMRSIPRPGDCLIAYADGHMSHARSWPKQSANSNFVPPADKSEAVARI